MNRINTDRTRTREGLALGELTEAVIGAVLEVSNGLGVGFLEKVYERALARELAMRGLRARSQAGLTIQYKGYSVGEYFVDLLVEDLLVVELKCVERLGREHTAQCLNYLRASGRRVCLLVNFQRPKVEWKRVMWGVEGDGERGGVLATGADGDPTSA